MKRSLKRSVLIDATSLQQLREQIGALCSQGLAAWSSDKPPVYEIDPAWKTEDHVHDAAKGIGKDGKE